MNIGNAFPSNYIKASDLQGRVFTLLMGRVEMEKIGQDQLPVLHFQNSRKGLVLNRTNATTIEDIYGPETDNWFGQKIDLYPDVTDFQGRRVDCIRVKRSGPPATGGAAVPPLAATLPPLQPDAPVNPPTSGDLDDDIPF